jgi:hypothetical protein
MSFPSNVESFRAQVHRGFAGVIALQARQLSASFIHAMTCVSGISHLNMTSGLEHILRDARLLVLFDEIYRGQSMTRAA